MIEGIQSICINTACACAAGVGAVAVAYGVARGMKFLSGGVKCVTAVSLVGSLVFGGMVVTSVRIAAAKTNDTQQGVGGLSNTIDVGQVEGTANVLRGALPALPAKSCPPTNSISPPCTDRLPLPLRIPLFSHRTCFMV